ncbi:MAG: arsenate reductase [Planctomycetota bacterium]|jgi:arsenate reductase
MLKILHNPRCSKSRQTLGILQDKGIEVQIIEYLKENPTKEELQDILSKLDKKPQEIIRKGEAIFKENFKGKEFSDKEWLTILVENPKLIERPIVFDEKKAVIGRPPESVEIFF